MLRIATVGEAREALDISGSSICVSSGLCPLLDPTQTELFGNSCRAARQFLRASLGVGIADLRKHFAVFARDGRVNGTAASSPGFGKRVFVVLPCFLRTFETLRKQGKRPARWALRESTLRLQ